MAVTFVGVGTGSSQFGNVAVSAHASTAIGDLLIGLGARDEGYGTDSWTGGTLTKLGGIDAGAVTDGGRLEVWWGFAAAAGATAFSYNDTNTGNTTGTAHLATFRGAAQPTLITTGDVTTNPVPAPSVGSGTLDALVCFWVFRGGTGAGAGAKTTFTPPAGMTTLGMIQPTGNWIDTAASYQIAVTAGAKTCTIAPTSPKTLVASLVIPAAAAASTPPRRILVPHPAARMRSFNY